MDKFIGLLVIVAIALVLTLPFEILRRRALRRFWNRPCMGIRWRRQFPDAPKTEIREFLTLFVDAFGYKHKRRTCFSPDDLVRDVYQAEYPPGFALADGMELETLGMDLEERYGVDLHAVWRENITLGELYAHTRTRAA